MAPELRVAQDPHFARLSWRMNGLQLEIRWKLASGTPSEWTAYSPMGQVRREWRGAHTPARIALWRDLLINPCATDA